MSDGCPTAATGSIAIVLFDISHTTVYSYDQPIFFEPHTFRLRPRADFVLKPLDFNLVVEPAPAGLSHALDLEGNVVTHAWFSGVSDTLTIKAISKIESSARNPFDFIVIEPAAERLPLRYSAAAPSLAPYLARPAGEVDRWAESVAQSAAGETLAFLTALCQAIRDRSRYTVREEGEARRAEETLKSQEGSCRDLAVLFIDACRAQGIAARFVSGYHDSRVHMKKRYMHAWAEVYLPGGGWRGFDPTLGMAVAEEHIPVAAAADPKDAAPVTGTFRGAGVGHKLAASISISRSA
jgi:transglutaminase-like putative cysteine protease